MDAIDPTAIDFELEQHRRRHCPKCGAEMVCTDSKSIGVSSERYRDCKRKAEGLCDYRDKAYVREIINSVHPVRKRKSEIEVDAFDALN
jgi:hypothetical protein